MAVSQFRDSLDRLGLGQYHDGLVQEAFDSWDVLADITEEDLDALGVKLGHRRILQRAIAESRKDDTQPAPAADVSQSYKPNPGKTETSAPLQDPCPGVNQSSRAPTGSKRKYRRHPKPDENAPDRPPSAYVLFSNQVREHLKGKDLSFTEIAKTVGERWQVLPPDEKASYESKSQAMKDHYYSQLAEYKKTQDYADYQRYLTDFKAKHEPSNGKRLKEDNADSPSRRNSDERLASSPDNRESSANSSERLYGDRRRSGFGSPQLVHRVDWRPVTLSENRSPEIVPGITPLEPGFSPRHTKPAFASVNGSNPSTPALSNGSRTKPQMGPPIGDHPMAVSTSLAYGYHPSLTPQGSDSPPIMPPSRRPTIASETSLPSLRHSDSIGSGHSSGSPVNAPPLGPSNSFSRTLPSRELPPPVPSRSSSGLPTTLPPMKKPSGSPQIRYSPPTSGLATLLRAGEHLASNGSMDGTYEESRYP